jgi:Pyruvate/2-oxoacid:ferredoxin oxidoreductase gamma subunit
VATIDATEIAVKHKLGSLAAPIVNTAMVGAIVKILNLTRLDSLLAAIAEGVPVKPEANTAAAEEAYGKAERVL